MEAYDYSKADILQSLSKIGLTRNDNILVHSNLGFFGKFKGATDSANICQAFKEAIFEIIGENGTLVVPTFTYSFCWDQVYDKLKTETNDCGVFSEFIRKDPLSLRSDDGIHSIAAIGNNAKIFTENAPEHSFGKDSFWERFLNLNGKVCRFNLSPDFNTFIHYVEKTLEVKYRWDKKFTGIAVVDGKKVERINYHFVRDLNDQNTIPDLSKLDIRMKELGLVKFANLGKGQILCTTCKDVLETTSKEIEKNPNFLIKGTFS